MEVPVEFTLRVNVARKITFASFWLRRRAVPAALSIFSAAVQILSNSDADKLQRIDL
jgi:hypothetical protein